MIYLVSDYSRCKNIIPILDKHLDLAPVTLWNPMQRMNFTKQVMAYADTYENPSVLTSGLGSALQKLDIYEERRQTIMSVNMLPSYKSLKKNRQFGVMTKTFSRALAMMVLLLGVWTGGVVLPQFFESQRVSRDFENLKTESETIKARLEGATNSLKEAGRNIDLIRTVRNPSGKTYLLETLPDLMPDGAELASMSVVDSNVIEITGYAQSDKVIFFFQNEIAASGLIEGISVTTNEIDDLIQFTHGQIGDYRMKTFFRSFGRKTASSTKPQDDGNAPSPHLWG